jgi:hypothetical protein
MPAFPELFDPVEQQVHCVPLTPIERVREAIYAWMDTEAGTELERATWNRFRNACRDWVGNQEHRPCQTLKK